MHERNACLTVLVALVAAMAVPARAAETSFENKVATVLAPEGSIKAAVSGQKQMSVDLTAQDQQDQEDFQAESIDARGPGGGPGPRPPSPSPRPPSPRPPSPRPPSPRPPSPRPPSPNPRPNPGPRPGPHPGPRPPSPRPPEHPTHPLPPDHHHGDWDRWHGHPGWGHHHDGWDWDRYGRPHWWGWVIWTGERRAECEAYYGSELRGCNDSCAVENDSCVQSCSTFGDPNCTAQCEVNSRYCRDSCAEDYDQRVITCPAF